MDHDYEPFIKNMSIAEWVQTYSDINDRVEADNEIDPVYQTMKWALTSSRNMCQTGRSSQKSANSGVSSARDQAGL